jgi:hypothetical protein
VSENIELSSLDLRYENHRRRDDGCEARLLTSIARRGIETPLEGVDPPQGRFLLNGFKRYRCAQKLSIGNVPYVSLGPEEATGILMLMRGSTDKALGILEQARFLDDLLTVHGMSLTEVAETLSRSKAWVSLRRSLLAELSPVLREALFRGTFPMHCFLYTLRSFKRVNGAKPEDIDRFVTAVAGQRLSVRDVELLAQGYFRGPPALREAIDGGKLGWSLEQMKQVPQDQEGCDEFERVLLEDLQRLRKYLERVQLKSIDPRLKSRAFYAQANLLTGALLSRFPQFHQSLKEFHDRSGQA